MSTSDGASLVIEATEPVPYVATRPDPLTLLLDFRNVAADGRRQHRRLATRRSPIAAVAVEASEALGAPASRVRITLSQAVAYRVRADRNTDRRRLRQAADRRTQGARYVLPPRRGRRRQRRQRAAAARASRRAAPSIPSRRSASTPGAAGRPARRPVTAGMPRRPLRPPPQAPSSRRQPTPPPRSARRGNERRFTGNPVSLDFQGADLRAVLRTFSEISGLNIVDRSGGDRVRWTWRCATCPWDQALDIILRANKLGYLVDGTIVRIAPLAVFADEESQRRKLTDEQALAGELRVLTKTLSYAKAEELHAPADQERAVAARHGALRCPDEHADHHDLPTGCTTPPT